jgi:hypothetical protein
MLRVPAVGLVGFKTAKIRMSLIIFSGTAFPFALTLVELLCGSEKRSEIRAAMVFPDGTPF